MANLFHLSCDIVDLRRILSIFFFLKKKKELISIACDTVLLHCHTVLLNTCGIKI
jgi:hypothetical protein